MHHVVKKKNLKLPPIITQIAANHVNSVMLHQEMILPFKSINNEN